jgi:homoserine trans-succinylase
VRETGVCYETTKKYLQDLMASGYIKQIGNDKGKNVYIFNKNRDKPTVYMVKHKHYTLESIQERYRRQIQRQREELDLL